MNSIHALRWIGYFVSAGVDVHIVNVGLEEHERLAGATYHDAERPVTEGGLLRQFMHGYRPFKTRLGAILDEVQPDIVHVHGVSIYVYVAKRCGFTPVIATAWGSEVLIDPARSTKYRFFVRSALRAADLITCDAEHIKDRMVELGARVESIELVYFGTDVKLFRPEKRDAGLAAELGFEQGTRLVVSLRALRPVYDIGTLIRAIPAVVRDNQMVGFIIVGDGPERDALKQLAEELHIDEHVRFTGRVSDAELQRYSASADVYVSTSLSDAGLAASTAEAMACAVPPVVSDFGNNRDWIDHGVNGFLFPLRAANALAEQISRVLQDPTAARAMGARAREVIVSRNNWHDEMARVMHLYQQTQAGSAA